jgi:uncharacterized protein (DUF4415 family)
MKLYPTIPEFKEGLGFSREDWDAVDSPPLTDEELARMRPLKEVLPWLHEKIQASKKGRGMQKAPTKELVSLRLDKEIIEKFKASGAGWQTRINEALKAV